ncbi:MAG: ABC transporter ATP-binding protein [Acidobacteria bacterium]|nr:ABC transporter ATP-binding protein [Acidobacteriota bacterium]
MEQHHHQRGPARQGSPRERQRCRRRRTSEAGGERRHGNLRPPSLEQDSSRAESEVQKVLSGRTGVELSTSAIEIKNVSKTYRGESAPVLDDINVTLEAGEFVCLLGASGCGKTTLLNLVSGLDVTSGGSIEKNGKVSVIFQESALFPWLSAGRNIELALRAAGVPKAERKDRARELLRLVHLDQAYDKRPHELSGGMKQRVAIARALAQDAKILLMDEPFAALDAITRDFLHEEISTVWKERGLTIVFVTHNVREAIRLGQRVLLLSSKPGRVIREWTVDLPQPRNIDDPAVAMLAAEITSELRKEISRHATR